MAELESAEELTRRVLGACSCWGEIEGPSGGIPLVEADRAAVALAAKRELLEEYAKLVASMWAGGYGECAELNDAYDGAHARLLAKYAAAEPAVEPTRKVAIMTECGAIPGNKCGWGECPNCAVETGEG